MSPVDAKCVSPMSNKYSMKQLLALRCAATRPAELNMRISSEIDAKLAVNTRTPSDKTTVIKFRKDASANSVKFVEDMDVPVTHIVRAYNLSNRVTWPILKTFCEETVGVPSLDVRMMRRKKPPEARIVFRSEQEAERFLAQLPDKPSIEGRVPKFEHESTVHTHPTKIGNVFVCTVMDAVQVANVSEVGDDCCAKVKGAEESVEIAMVPTEEAVVQQDGLKKSQFKVAKAGEQGSFNGGRKFSFLDRARFNSGVDMPSEIFHFESNSFV